MFIRGNGSREEYPFIESDNNLTCVMALAYSRFRGIDVDWHRVEHQLTGVQLYVTELKSPNIAMLNSLADDNSSRGTYEAIEGLFSRHVLNLDFDADSKIIQEFFTEKDDKEKSKILELD